MFRALFSWFGVLLLTGCVSASVPNDRSIETEVENSSASPPFAEGTFLLTGGLFEIDKGSFARIYACNRDASSLECTSPNPLEGMDEVVTQFIASARQHSGQHSLLDNEHTTVWVCKQIPASSSDLLDASGWARNCYLEMLAGRKAEGTGEMPSRIIVLHGLRQWESETGNASPLFVSGEENYHFELSAGFFEIQSGNSLMNVSRITVYTDRHWGGVMTFIPPFIFPTETMNSKKTWLELAGSLGTAAGRWFESRQPGN
jgi:hypothetical protein